MLVSRFPSLVLKVIIGSAWLGLDKVSDTSSMIDGGSSRGSSAWIPPRLLICIEDSAGRNSSSRAAVSFTLVVYFIRM
ncbi:hypothetical protein D3C79_732280 [compost metagenome]